MRAEESRSSDQTTKTRALLWLLLVLAIAVALAAQTLSVITREHPARARIQFGGVALETHIVAIDISGNEVAAPENEQLGMGVAHTKRIVRIENTGAHPLFSRVRLSFECIDGQGEAHDMTDLVRFEPAAESDVSWTASSDGAGVLFYLNEPIGAGETSAPLALDLEVDTAEAFAQYGEGCTFKFVADGQGVQSENQKTQDVMKAEGWPE